jgi:hypothetical protein
MTAVAVAAVFAVALAAFATEGAIGFGGTVIVACIGAQFVPLDVLLPAFVPINIALSSWLAVSGRKSVAWQVLLRQITPPVAAGAAVGLVAFRVVESAGAHASAALALIFGVFVVMLAALQLRAGAGGGQLSLSKRVALLIAGGVAHGLFGTGGPMIVYVTRRELPGARTFRATLAILWLALNAALLASFASQGLYAERPTLETGVILAIAFVPGLAIGERVHRKLAPARFERAVWLLLLVAGAALTVRSAFGLS